MDNLQVTSLKDLVPVLIQQILPLVKDSVEVCVRAYSQDPFNDNWTFGTQLWRNTWNRIRSVAEIEATAIELPGKGNDYYFSIGNITIHHHRVEGADLLPTGAKAVKTYIDQLQLPLPLFPQEPTRSLENVILGIAADPRAGLTEVIVGILAKDSLSEDYVWSEKISLYRSSLSEATIAPFTPVGVEEEVAPVVTFKSGDETIATPVKEEEEAVSTISLMADEEVDEGN